MLNSLKYSLKSGHVWSQNEHNYKSQNYKKRNCVIFIVRVYIKIEQFKISYSLASQVNPIVFIKKDPRSKAILSNIITFGFYSLFSYVFCILFESNNFNSCEKMLGYK